MQARGRHNQRDGVLIALVASGLVTVSITGGWLLGQHQALHALGSPEGSPERQVALLQARLGDGSASAADQQRLVDLLIQQGQSEEASLVLERLADQQSQNWQLRLLLAELRRNNNDRPGAERELRQILNLKPDQIEALQLLTLLQLEQGRGAEAETQLKALLKAKSKPTPQPQKLGIGLLLGDLRQRQGKPAEALALYGQLAKDFPRDPKPLLAIALLKQDQGDLPGASQALAQAQARQPGKKDPRLDRVAASWGLQTLRETKQPPAKEPSPKAKQG